MAQANSIKIKTTETFEKLNHYIDKGYSNIIMQGGSRSGKTYAAFQTMGLLAATSVRPLRIFIVLKTMIKVTKTLLGETGDFKIAIQSLGLWDDKNLNKQARTFKLNNSEFIFFGLDKTSGADVARGPRSDICFVNEIDQIDAAIIKQLFMRNSGLFICDFNPSVSENHFVYSWLEKQPKTIRFISTFKDNFYAPAKAVATILGYEPTQENIKRGTADEQYWKIFGLGHRCALEGLIFPETKRKKISEWPKDVATVAYGMDFGFSDQGDPCTLVRFGYGTKDKQGLLFMEEKMYQRGMYVRHNPQDPKVPSIEKELLRLGIEKNIPIIADSEDPLAIKEIKSLGYNIMPAVKGKGSVKDGIELLRKFSFRVVEPSENLLDELNRYKWKTTKDGIQLGEPVKGFDHCIAKGQKVLTKRGNIPIEEVTNLDYVMTRGGWRKVKKAWLTQLSASVCRITTNIGVSITVTPDHKIFTSNRGFIEAAKLEYSDTLKTLAPIRMIVAPTQIEYLDDKVDVYDIEVDDDTYHEFFVEGILVHNCIDPLRYCLLMTYSESGFMGSVFVAPSTVRMSSGADKYDEGYVDDPIGGLINGFTNGDAETWTQM